MDLDIPDRWLCTIFIFQGVFLETVDQRLEIHPWLANVFKIILIYCTLPLKLIDFNSLEGGYNILMLLLIGNKFLGKILKQKL